MSIIEDKKFIEILSNKEYNREQIVVSSKLILIRMDYMMKEKRAMEAVFQYLKEQQISYKQIKKDTEIDISSDRTLTATEFLNLCVYLRKKPEDFAALQESGKHD